jgi:hypothetical protein
MISEDAKLIREQNERLRANGPFTIDKSIMDLEDLAGLFKAIREYDSFDDGVDDEHYNDYGSLTWHGVKIEWLIDYVDPSCDHYYGPLDEDTIAILQVYRAKNPQV